RPHADRNRACFRGGRVAADDQRTSRQAGRCAADPADETGPPPLLPARRTAYRTDAREHHERRPGRAAAFSAQIEIRRTTAPRAHLLRSYRRRARRRSCRPHDGTRPAFLGRRGRRSDRDRRRVSVRARRRPGGGARAAPRVLPAVPRLDRTAPAHWRRRRRGARQSLFRSEMDRAAARQSRADDHARGPPRLDASIFTDDLASAFNLSAPEWSVGPFANIAAVDAQIVRRAMIRCKVFEQFLAVLLPLAPEAPGIGNAVKKSTPGKGSPSGQKSDRFTAEIARHVLCSKKMSRAILPRKSFWRDPLSGIGRLAPERNLDR